MAEKLYVDPDIRRASTLPASFYRDPLIFEQLRPKVFHRTWQFIDAEKLPVPPVRTTNFQLLNGFISAPLLLSRDNEENYHCLSNVCTHRGNLLSTGPSGAKKLVCGYHGRRFSLDGRFEFMPEFEQAEAFPSACDNLPSFPLRPWGPLWMTSLDPAFEFSEIAGIMDERIGFMSPETFRLAPERSRSYEIRAHWALYCDNYLEGFHIPFVHKDLDAVLDYGAYETLLFEHCNLQVGYAGGSGDAVFDFPVTHPDYGKKIAAYYFWVFPNLMFNFYPWGLSLNIVNPVAPDRTRVDFISYVSDPGKLGKGAGADLDKVELEDEAVVEGVQHGIQSGYYQSGRFSPTREKGVHHFHSLLARFMNA
jgi:choline monooxygenase